MRKVFIQQQYDSTNDITSVRTLPDFWEWMQKVYVPAIYTNVSDSGYDSDGNLYIRYVFGWETVSRVDSYFNRVMRSPTFLVYRASRKNSVCSSQDDQTALPYRRCMSKGNPGIAGFSYGELNTSPITTAYDGITYTFAPVGRSFRYIWLFDDKIDREQIDVCQSCKQCCNVVKTAEEGLRQLDIMMNTKFIDEETLYLALVLDVQVGLRG